MAEVYNVALDFLDYNSKCFYILNKGKKRIKHYTCYKIGKMPTINSILKKKLLKVMKVIKEGQI